MQLLEWETNAGNLSFLRALIMCRIMKFFCNSAFSLGLLPLAEPPA